MEGRSQAPDTAHRRHQTLSEPQWWAPSHEARDVGAEGSGHPDSQRSARSVTCPLLRLETTGALLEPGDAPSEDHRCVAIAGPRVLSRQQQELVCLRAAHVDCPRYRRATAGGSSTVRGRIRIPTMPRATAAALVILALSAGVSFGFVLQRGGIDLPSAAVSSGGVGAVASGVIGSASPGPSAAAATPAVSPLPTSLASNPASASSSPATPVPTSTPAPAATRSPATKPTPASSATGGVPSADRLAVIKPCPGQAGCWIYKVRAGDNLWSIAHWFGVPLDTIYAWNPTVKQAGIEPGTPLRIPTPTR